MSKCNHIGKTTSKNDGTQVIKITKCEKCGIVMQVGVYKKVNGILTRDFSSPLNFNLDD